MIPGWTSMSAALSCGPAGRSTLGRRHRSILRRFSALAFCNRAAGQAVYVPAATPKPVIDRLAQALQLALADPKVRRSFEDSGLALFSPDRQSPEAAAAMLRNEIERWGDVIRANNVEMSPQ
jgi:hypothetical protein